MVEQDDGAELRRGWQLSDEVQTPEMPEGFSWSWQGGEAAGSPVRRFGGPYPPANATGVGEPFGDGLLVDELGLAESGSGTSSAPFGRLDGQSAGVAPVDAAESFLVTSEAAHPSNLAEPELDSVGAATGEENRLVPFSDSVGGFERDGEARQPVPADVGSPTDFRDYDEYRPVPGEQVTVAPTHHVAAVPAPHDAGADPAQEAAPDGTPTAAVSRETAAGADVDTPIAREAQAAVEALSRSARPLPRPQATRVFVVANQKGGVGKTTTTVNIAASLAQYGARVLVVDLDPQGNASTALGIDHHAEVPSIYDVLIERHTLAEVVCPVADVEGLYCAPATIDLAGAEIELVSMVARESRLQRALLSYPEPMDYVFIDCPPSLGLLTINALVAGQEVLIPIQCEYYALEGLGQLLRNIELVRGHLNTKLRVSTILLTMYDARTRLAAQVADEVRTHFPREVLRTAVPRSVRISEAPSYSQTVMTYDPASSGALAYREAAREIAEREEQRVARAMASGADDAQLVRQAVAHHDQSSEVGR
jgi:chromosome partitioning protein